jgi:hypothetical protein
VGKRAYFEEAKTARSNLTRQVEHFAGFLFERGATLRFAEAARDYLLSNLFKRRARFVARGVLKVHSEFLLSE